MLTMALSWPSMHAAFAKLLVKIHSCTAMHQQEAILQPWDLHVREPSEMKWSSL
jgi:hypothetical protein